MLLLKKKQRDAGFEEMFGGDVLGILHLDDVIIIEYVSSKLYDLRFQSVREMKSLFGRVV
jgi:hypothetical protein